MNYPLAALAKSYNFWLVTLAALLAPALMVTNNWIAGCNGYDYSEDSYIGYCESGRYGDYEHGAFYFELENGIKPYLQRAEVVFLGNSRTQVAFSADPVKTFFASRGVPHYVLGFGYGESALFAQKIIEKFAIAPKVVVINADPFFTGTMSKPAYYILNNASQARKDYGVKQLWQRIQSELCDGERGALARLMCEGHTTVYRSRVDGSWSTIHPGEERSVPLQFDEDYLLENVAYYIDNARRFRRLFDLPDRCVVITVVPSDSATVEVGRRIAASLGASFIFPALPRLATSDQSHLDRESARAWSAAFLEAFEPVMRACVGAARQAAGSPATTVLADAKP